MAEIAIDSNTSVPTHWEYCPFSQSFPKLVRLLKLLYDAIPEDETALGEAVLSSSFSLLESIANSLLSAIPNFSAEVKNKIEQWPILEKFDILCSIRINKPLDRSIFNPVLQFANPRNQKIHPKPKRVKIKKLEKKDENFLFETETVPYQMSKDKGIFLVVAVFKFLDHFLLDLCNCTPDSLGQLLGDIAARNNKTYYFQNVKLFPAKEVLQKLIKIEPRFLSFIRDFNTEMIKSNSSLKQS